MSKGRRLGRGLSSLFSKTTEESVNTEDTIRSQLIEGDGARPATPLGGGEGKASEDARGAVEAAQRAGADVGHAGTDVRGVGGAHATGAAESGGVSAGDIATGSDTSVSLKRADSKVEEAVTESAGAVGAGVEARMVNVSLLSANPRQPRSGITERSVAALTRSIRQTGILQPITVRARGDGYEVVTGERRWRAAEAAGLREVPAVVRDVSDEEMLEMALVENIQREDLNAIDRALAYEQYCRRFQKRPEEVARRLGEDRSSVVNFLRLLELPDEVRELVAKGLLSAGHGRSLLGLGKPEQMVLLARTIVKEGLPVRAVEDIVRRSKGRGDRGGPGEGRVARPAKSAHMRDLENRLSVACGTKVVVEEGRKKGRGKIVIEYYSLDDFDRVARKLGVTLEE